MRFDGVDRNTNRNFLPLPSAGVSHTTPAPFPRLGRRWGWAVERGLCSYRTARHPWTRLVLPGVLCGAGSVLIVAGVLAMPRPLAVTVLLLAGLVGVGIARRGRD